MRISDASDASDALGNFFSPKKKILFFLCVCLTNFFPENLFFILMSSDAVKTVTIVTIVTFVDLTRPFLKKFRHSFVTLLKVSSLFRHFMKYTWKIACYYDFILKDLGWKTKLFLSDEQIFSFL